MNLQDRAQGLREAGEVRRAHTMPHHGTYTVAGHTWHCLNLLLLLHPNPSRALMIAVQWHDVHERWAGDLPAPAKWASGELAKQYDLLATRIEQALGVVVELSPEDRLWLTAVDRIECLLWAKDQVAMGNLAANSYIGALARWFRQNPMPQPCVEFVENHEWRRLHDGIPRPTGSDSGG